MTTLPLFDIRPGPDGRETIRPHFAEPEDVPRLTAQNAAILARLRQGPATARDLIDIALNYRARISEIRAWLKTHENLTIQARRLTGGMFVYRLTAWRPNE